MATYLYRLGHLCARRRGTVFLLWMAILIGIALAANAAGGKTSETFDLPGTESQRAADLLAERFPAQSGSTMRVVFEIPEGGRQLTPEELTALGQAIVDVQFLPGVVTPAGFVEGQTPTEDQVRSLVTVSPSQTIAFIEIRFEKAAQEVDPDDVNRIMDTFERAAPPIAQINYGGDVINATEEGEPPASEAIGLGVAVIVLLFTFGSFVAMGLPLVTALIGVGIGSLGISFASAFIDVSSVAPTLAVMIGLAVGIDYALFVVTRHRQFLHEGLDVAEAAARANATSGGAVVFAGVSVVIAIAGLVVAGIPFLTIMGFAAAFTVFIAVCIAITLTPALLALVGHGIDKWSLPGVKATAEDSTEGSGLSTRLARWAVQHPIPALVVGLAIIAVLAYPLLDLRLGLPDDGSKPELSTQRQAYDTLARGFGPGFNGPLTLVTDLDGVADPEELLAAIAGAVAADPNVAAVIPPIANAAGDTAIITVIPKTGPADEATTDLVHRLRDRVLPALGQEADTRVSITGTTALNVDISDKLGDALPVFMAVVILLTMLLLAIAFRSILIPVKAAIAILLSIGAAFGVVVAVFQWGWFSDLIGVNESVPIVSFLPLMMFAILFGLSMDYEVFIISRIREDYMRNGGQAHAAVLSGLTSSARVVTAAALIMISVFAAFVLGDDVIIKMFGVGLATAVFLDATIVRMVIVPSVMALLDRAAWWLPRWLDRALPNLDVEGEQLLQQLEGSGVAHVQPVAEAAAD